MTSLERGSPAAIFQTQLRHIDKLLMKAKRARAFKDRAFAVQFRASLFKLEGWAKIHRHWPNKKEQKIFASIRDHAKKLEDCLAALDVALSMAADLTKRKQPAIALIFEERAKKAQRELKHQLHDADWFSDGETRVEKMIKSLGRVDWPSVDRQISYLEKALVKDVNSVNEDFRGEWKPKLLSPNYNRDIVENALHKFRRQLRWFPIYFQTAEGIFGLGPLPNVLTSEKRKLVADYENNPFARLPKSKNNRYLIDRIAYYQLTRLIDQVGEIKDKAESYIYLRDALIKSGDSELKAAERAQVVYGQAPEETPIATHKLLAEYERFKPLAYIGQSLQS